MGRLTPRLLVLFLAALYLGGLKVSYFFVIAPLYTYQGLKAIAPGPGPELLSWLFAFLPLAWIPLTIDRPSRLFLWFQYLLVYIPVCVVPLYAVGWSSPPVLLLWLTLAAMMLAVGGVALLPTVRLPRPQVPRTVAIAATLAFAFACLFPIYLSFGLRFSPPSLADVYSVRDELRTAVTGGGPMLAYGLPWAARVLSPLLLIVGLRRRQGWLVAASFGVTLYVFSVSGLKSAALTPFFVIALWVMFRRWPSRASYLMTGGLVGLVIGGLGLIQFAGLGIVTNLLVRRSLVTPGLLTGYWYDFFTSNPGLGLWAIFRGGSQQVYDLAPAFLIGATYFGVPEMSANANLWASAMAGGGLWGCFVILLPFLAFIWLLDAASEGLPVHLACAFVGVGALTLTNAALPTVLVTHGLLLILGLLWLLPRDQRGPVAGVAP